VRDDKDRVERHFVILCFAARWRAGSGPERGALGSALARSGRARRPADHPGLSDIAAMAYARLKEAG